MRVGAFTGGMRRGRKGGRGGEMRVVGGIRGRRMGRGGEMVEGSGF